MTCNFTAVGKDERGMLAIVQRAHYYEDFMPPSQKKFAGAVFEAFGVS